MSEGWLLAGAGETEPWSEPDYHGTRGPTNGVSTSVVVAAPTATPDVGSETDMVWRDHAACRSTSPDLFFPVGATGIALVEIAAAKFVCSQCVVREPCLEFALTTNQEYGVWGGFSEEERRVLRRRRRQANSRAAAAPSAGVPSDAC
jgi:WhiB family transcriptional regulator, redox-sensing transcriptional regulator